MAASPGMEGGELHLNSGLVRRSGADSSATTTCRLYKLTSSRINTFVSPIQLRVIPWMTQMQVKNINLEFIEIISYFVHQRARVLSTC